MLRVEEIELRLISYGPVFKFRGMEVGPDLFIALEGIGTFKGITAEERLRELEEKGKDLEKTALTMHLESTRRGHASLATSLILQFEVRRCSRAASLLLVAPPFASYLQESQRRRKVSKGDFMMPPGIEGSRKLEKIFSEAVERSWKTYDDLIRLGIPLEDARYVLPLASGTSIFVTGSLETFTGLMFSSRLRDERYYPRELKRLGELVEEAARRVAPILTSARLSFKSPLPAYPYPDPYKPEDELMENLVKSFGEPDEPVLVGLEVWDEVEKLRKPMGKLEEAASLNPLIHATFLEPLSLSAYHQSIRHRTVPTAVEPIYGAVERAARSSEKGAVIPPSIKSKERGLKMFQDTVSSLIEAYRALLDEDAHPSDAIYLTPQAVRIYVARTYNAFNLLWPQGYVATRTCGYAQWEERSIAYTIWRKVEERVPWLGRLMGEKCRHLGYCPEKSWCPVIKKYYPGYGDEEHRKMGGEI